MKGKLVLTILFFAYCVNLYSQGLTQSADGKSTVLFKGNNISLDIGKTNLDFGFNNLFKTVGRNKCFFLGGDANAKNQSGIGEAFSKGSLSPSSQIKGFLGFSWSNSSFPSIDAQEDFLLGEKDKLIQTLEGKVIRIIKLNLSGKNKELANKLIDTLNKNHDVLEVTAAITADNTIDSVVKKEILKKIADSQNEYMNSQKGIDASLDTINKIYGHTNYWQILFFGYGGINASGFQHFVGYDTANLKKSFAKEDFQGGMGGIGLNIQWRNLILGTTFDLTYTDNFNLLTSKDYTLKNTITSGGQTITEEKQITAYSGAYGKVQIYNLNIDLIGNFKLDKAAKNHVLVNPYIRMQVGSNTSSLLPNSTNVGCGFYFFQQSGKFLGGFYVELPDVDNNYEKAKPIAEQDLREPINRISFGVVSKFSFSSLLNLF